MTDNTDKIEFGCYCDCDTESGELPQLCVVDDPNFSVNDCRYASLGINKEDCKYWKSILEYKPYGDEWQSEMMKLTKKDLVLFLRKQLMKNKA